MLQLKIQFSSRLQHSDMQQKIHISSVLQGRRLLLVSLMEVRINVHHGQTQLASISTFQRHNLDMVVGINTCPGNSWANPTERMSVLNLALNGVSLSREEMSKEKEELIKTPSNMKEMRAAAEKNPDVKAVINDSLQKPLSILNNRFS